MVPLSVYLDANASEPVRPEAVTAWQDAVREPGNPSSLHRAGRRARDRQETARETLAMLYGAGPDEVIFTSGGTEADSLAVHVLGVGRRLLLGATEHPALLSCRPDAEMIGIDHEGVTDLHDLEARLAQGGQALVCLMLANNETGVIQPVAQAAVLCRQYGAFLHVDAAQAAGRMEVSMRTLDADSMALSAHKLGGVPGVGALLLRDAAHRDVRPLMKGGGQERGWRGGTPALPAISAFAAAARAAMQTLSPDEQRGASARLIELRDRLEQAATLAGAVVAGGGARLGRLPNTSCLILPGVAAHRQVMALDLAGIQVSAGSACSSGKVSRSHVLAAMGFGQQAGEAIRVSLPWNVTEVEVQAFMDAYATMAARLRAEPSSSPFPFSVSHPISAR
ncbi:Selenocysteine lyase [Granulibacter bethesdensis]|uniref:Cysteine desulfurase n=1 Tax=Granulibacter bethesdensis TaxID=364410 RepID=A0AAC9KBG9_9PROT|nr:cysteine desulfurase family protein [Granulibacter bethesdensis]APH55259.1 Selenocysteine lyase [Granulibacter bethesdensis]APH62846.1 Selenocysteine lyase [Granulibacter bethesdensis]